MAACLMQHSANQHAVEGAGLGGTNSAGAGRRRGMGLPLQPVLRLPQLAAQTQRGQILMLTFIDACFCARPTNPVANAELVRNGQ